jgi:hypothetical protein
MDLGADHGGADEWFPGALYEWDVTFPYHIQDKESVPRGLFHALVSRHGRHEQEVQFWGGGGQE